MASWPDVEVGRGDPPPASGDVIDDGLVRTREPAVVAWGRVNGIPWRLEAWETAPGPNAKWWEHGPVGPEMAFWLGEESSFGGGGVETRLNEGTHIAATGHFFGSVPDFATWTGVVSDRVARLEVRVGGETKSVEPQRGPPWLPRFFCFFVGRGVGATAAALAADGSQLQAEALPDVDVPPYANAGTSVNGFGYPVGRPPPGWPDDPTQYAPGEGPRHAEDFHLHDVTFPLYVVPPELWDGYTGPSGSGRSGSTVQHVDFGYFDEPGGSERGFEIVNEDPHRNRPFDIPLQNDNVGIWWDRPFGSDDTVNFVTRFLTREEVAAFTDVRGFPNVGPLRVASIAKLEVAGNYPAAARIEYRRLPALHSLRFELPHVRVSLHSWGLTFEELEERARMLQRLELGTSLFDQMKAAQARSDARFREMTHHHHGGTDDG